MTGKTGIRQRRKCSSRIAEPHYQSQTLAAAELVEADDLHARHEGRTEENRAAIRLLLLFRQAGGDVSAYRVIQNGKACQNELPLSVRQSAE